MKVRISSAIVFACLAVGALSVSDFNGLPFAEAQVEQETKNLLIADVQFSGVTVLDDRTARRVAALRAGEEASEMAITTAIDRLQKEYARQGYPYAEIQADVRRRTNTPHGIVHLAVQEGPLVRISEVTIVGEIPRDVQYLREDIKTRALGAAASLRNRRSLRLEILSALRNEGYLEASVDLEEFKFLRDQQGVELIVRIEAREPITLQFVGNSYFTAKELLGPLKLDTRSVPFSPSALKQLLSEVVALYQAEGFFFAQASLQDLGTQGERQVYQVDVHEGKRYRLNSVEFTGNEKISSKELRPFVQLETQGPWFVRGLYPGYVQQRVVDADVQRLIEYYHEAAYDQVKIVARVLPEDEQGLAVIYAIDEGPRSEIEATSVEWSEDRPEDVPQTEIDRILDGLRGQPAEPVRIEATRNAFEELLDANGYQDYSVRGEYRADSKQMLFRIKPGERLRVHEVVIRGLVYTKESVVRDALGLLPGMSIRNSDLRHAEQVLYRLGVFHRVSINLVSSGSDRQDRDVVVDLFERDSGTLDLGTTFDSEAGLQLIGEVGQRNLAGTGNSLIFNVNGAQRSGNKILDAGTARALFLVPQYEGPDFLAEAYAQYSIQIFNPFSFDREGFSIALRSPQERAVRGVVRWTPFQERVYDIEPDVAIGPRDTGTTFYSFLRGELEWDRRNDPANPSSGYRIRAETQATERKIGADVSLASFRTTESYYIPMNSRLVWSHRAVQGIVRGFDGTEVVPLSQRFFLGGRDSLRGFSRYSVSPRGDLGDVLGGDTSVEYTSEFQYAVTENIGTSVFLDSGIAVLKQVGDFQGDPLSISWRDLSYSPGIGVRYKTPIGPIRLEVGFALDRQFGERPARIILAVGNPF